MAEILMVTAKLGRKFIPIVFKNIFIVAIFVGGYYLLLWLVSNIYAHLSLTTYTYRHDPVKQINGVDFEIRTNETSKWWHRNRLCPLFITGTLKGPYVIIFRAIDPEHSAYSLRIHSAILRQENGNEVPLNLVIRKEGRSDVWHFFFQNASQWIVHTYHKDRFDLSGEVDIEIDISVKKNEKVVRDSLKVKLLPLVKKRAGWRPIV